MSKTTNLLNEILKNGENTSGKEWRELIAAIKSKPDESKIFATNIKNKLKSLNLDTQLICLDLLDYAMVECKMPLHTAVSSKDFLNTLLNLIKTRDSPEVLLSIKKTTHKILYLIKKWGLRFESQKDIIPNFFESYMNLKNSGVTFPNGMDTSYHDFIGESKENHDNFIENKSTVLEIKENTSKSKFDLNAANYPENNRKFVSELSVILENIHLANEMISGSDHTKPIDDGLTCIIMNMKDLGKNLMIAIENQIKDDKLMNLCLAINDDIALTINRYDELKKKKVPRPFRSALKDEEEIVTVKTTNKEEKNVNVNQNNNNLINIFDDLNIGSKPTVNNNVSSNTNNGGNSKDIFDFLGQNNVNTSNNNQNQNITNANNSNNKQKSSNDIFSMDNNLLISTNNVKTSDNKPKLTDLISSLYENDYGNNSNNTGNKNLFMDNNLLNQIPNNQYNNNMMNPNMNMNNGNNYNNMNNMNNFNIMSNMNNMSSLNNMNNMSSLNNINNMSSMNNINNMSSMNNMNNMSTLNNMNNMNFNMFSNQNSNLPGINKDVRYPQVNPNYNNNIPKNSNPNNSNYPDFF